MEHPGTGTGQPLRLFILGKNHGLADRDTLFDRAFTQFGQKLSRAITGPAHSALKAI